MIPRALPPTEGACHEGTDDAALVGAARRGSPRSFGVLVAKYQSLVSAIAYALTGSASHSEEIAQETFIVAWKRLAEVREPDRFRGWICGIATRVARRSRRRMESRLVRSSVPLNAGEGTASGEASPLERLIDQEQEAILRRALAQIPDAYRLPLVLVYHQGLPMEKVAEALGTTPNNVHQRLWKGRKMLRNHALSLVERTLQKVRLRRDLTGAVVTAIEASETAPVLASAHAWRPGRPGQGGNA